MLTTKLKIRIYGDPCLRKKSKPVKKVGPGERLLIASMIETMHESKGIGLAAPQVGVNEQIMVVDVGEGPIVMVNPQIFRKHGSMVMEEGCLSIPGVAVKVRRPQKITVQYLDQDNKPVERSCDNLLARVVLHETDHLKGKLIIDYASLRNRIKMRPQLEELRRINRENKS